MAGLESSYHRLRHLTPADLRFSLPALGDGGGESILAAKVNGAVVTPTLDKIREEAERNHKVFRQIDASRLGSPGNYALMKAGEVTGIFATDRDALREGESRYADRLYSVHRIRREPGPAPTTARNPMSGPSA